MLKSGSELRRRDLYPNRRIAFQDAEPVKLITGIRRCGKSSLMKLMILHLRETGVADDRIIEMNFEFMDFRRITAEELYRYVKDQLPEKNRAYLFFDEIQRIDQWQDAVNSFRVVAEPAMYLTPAFQSMLPVRGAPGDSEGIYLDVYLFQSTLPARGATICGHRRPMACQPISIHAPHEGSDSGRWWRMGSPAHFNPRSP